MADAKAASNLAKMADFQRAVAVALSKKSKEVRNDEGATAAQLTLATRVVNRRAEMTKEFVWDVALEANIDETWTFDAAGQAAVDTAVGAVMSGMLKVYTT